jgi:hypothetical protein
MLAIRVLGLAANATELLESGLAKRLARALVIYIVPKVLSAKQDENQL